MNKTWLFTNITVLSNMAAAYETTCNYSQISGKALLISLMLFFLNEETHLKWLPIDYFRNPQLQSIFSADVYFHLGLGWWRGNLKYFARKFNNTFCFLWLLLPLLSSWTACLFLRDSQHLPLIIIRKETGSFIFMRCNFAVINRNEKKKKA